MKKKLLLSLLFTLFLVHFLYSQKLENLIVEGALRVSTSPVSDIICKIPYREVVKILSGPTTDGYYYIDYKDQKGFINEIFLTHSVPPINLDSIKINQFDSKRKKDGMWIEYLDANWKIVKDSAQATLTRYTYFYHGHNLFKESWMGEKLKSIGDSNSQNRKLVALNGEYIWHDSKGRLLFDAYYLNGQRIWEKNYSWRRKDDSLVGKKVFEYFDYRKKYKNQIFTSYYEMYDHNGNVIVFYFRNDDQGWAYYEE